MYVLHFTVRSGMAIEPYLYYWVRCQHSIIVGGGNTFNLVLHVQKGVLHIGFWPHLSSSRWGNWKVLALFMNSLVLSKCLLFHCCFSKIENNRPIDLYVIGLHLLYFSWESVLVFSTHLGRNSKKLFLIVHSVSPCISDSLL